MELKNSGTLVPLPPSTRRFYHPSFFLSFFLLLLLDMTTPALITDEPVEIHEWKSTSYRSLITRGAKQNSDGRTVGEGGVFYSAGRRETSIGTKRPIVDGLKAVRRPLGRSVPRLPRSAEIDHRHRHGKLEITVQAFVATRSFFTDVPCHPV